MKALLTVMGAGYPFTHILEELMDSLEAHGEVLPVTPFDPTDLEPFAVELRYHANSGLSSEERVAIAQTVVILRVHTLTRILQLERTPAP